MTESKPSQRSGSVGPRQVLAWAIVLLLLAYALSPALTRSHVEGFSYFTELMSMLVPDLSAADPLWSVNQQYFYLSRPGVIWAMAPLSALSPGNGYALLMWLALPLFLSGLAAVARCLSGASWLACVAALLFLPIAIEANFFNNDNVLATGFAAWAVVLVWAARTGSTVFAAGVLYGAAVLCRLDQVLLGPFFAALLLIVAPSFARFLGQAIAMGLGFVLIHAAFAFLDPEAANLLHRISVVSEADALWARGGGPLAYMLARDASAMLLAVGLGLPAIIAGTIALVRERGARTANGANLVRVWALPVLLIGYPFFVYALTAGRYYDPRGLLVMLPMLAPLAALGLDRWVIAPLLGRHIARELPAGRGAGVAALILVPFLIPGLPLLPNVLRLPVETENAAPTLTGRIWYTEAWRAWQTRGFHDPDRDVDTLLVGIVTEGPRSALILSTEWTDDRRLQNALAARGFAPVDHVFGACAPVSETWRHPEGAIVTHVRTHIPFLNQVHRKSAALFLAHGAECLASVPADARISLRSYGVRLTRAAPSLSLEPADDVYFGISDAELEMLAALAEDTVSEGRPDVDPAQLAQEELAEAMERLN